MNIECPVTKRAELMEASKRALDLLDRFAVSGSRATDTTLLTQARAILDRAIRDNGGWK